MIELTKKQYKYWEQIISTIDQYLQGQEENFPKVVSSLAGLLSGSEIRDSSFLKRWDEEWFELEILNACYGSEVNRSESERQLQMMKGFLLSCDIKRVIYLCAEQEGIWVRIIHLLEERKGDPSGVVIELEKLLDALQLSDEDLLEELWGWWGRLDEASRVGKGIDPLLCEFHNLLCLFRPRVGEKS